MPKMKKSDISLNEKDALQDMLDTEKQLMHKYDMAIQEGSTKHLRSSFMKNFQQLSSDQFTIFEEMQTKGYYQTQQADKQSIDQKVENGKQIQSQLSQEGSDSQQEEN
jgi:spore coat protein CotF